MNKILIILFLFLISSTCQKAKEFKVGKPSKQMQKLLTDFVDTDWVKVTDAAGSLMEIGKEAIPHLINLMQDEKKFAQLYNTETLIYPGSKESYSEGSSLNYELDWIAFRAGWVLEKLTFQNFGFTYYTLSDENESSKRLREIGTEEWLKEEKAKEIELNKNRSKRLRKAFQKARNWWAYNQDTWTHLGTIKEALYSEDEERLTKAIEHLRHRNYYHYKIPNITKEYYNKELKARIKELTKSKYKQVAESAKSTLKDDFDFK